MLYASLYGRFLLLQLENVGSVVIMNFMFACFAIMGDLTDRGADFFWLSWVYGDRAAEAMQAVRVSLHRAPERRPSPNAPQALPRFGVEGTRRAPCCRRGTRAAGG